MTCEPHLSSSSSDFLWRSSSISFALVSDDGMAAAALSNVNDDTVDPDFPIAISKPVNKRDDFEFSVCCFDFGCAHAYHEFTTNEQGMRVSTSCIG